MSKKNKKQREGIVYSTSDEFEYDYEGQEEQETLPPSEQNLKVQLDKKARAGKKVSLISGFIGTENDLKDLGKKVEIEMWCRRQCEGWRNSYPRRFSR